MSNKGLRVVGWVSGPTRKVRLVLRRITCSRVGYPTCKRTSALALRIRRAIQIKKCCRTLRRARGGPASTSVQTIFTAYRSVGRALNDHVCEIDERCWVLPKGLLPTTTGD